jgi:hypothetical protein
VLVDISARRVILFAERFPRALAVRTRGDQGRGPKIGPLFRKLEPVHRDGAISVFQLQPHTLPSFEDEDIHGWEFTISREISLEEADASENNGITHDYFYLTLIRMVSNGAWFVSIRYGSIVGGGSVMASLHDFESGGEPVKVNPAKSDTSLHSSVWDKLNRD